MSSPNFSRAEQRSLLVHLVKERAISISEACRRFGCSRKTAYKWLRRFDESPEAPLIDRSRRPLRSPFATSSDVEARVLDLRSLGMSSSKIQRRLRDERGSSPGRSTIYRILRGAQSGAVGNTSLDAQAAVKVRRGAIERIFLSLVGSKPVLQCVFQDVPRPDDIASLTALLTSRSVRERKRAATVFLLMFGNSRADTARFLGIAHSSTRRYFDLFKSTGIDGLRSVSRKTPKQFQENVQKSVFRVLHSPPSEYGFNRTTWRMSDVAKTLKRQGMPVSTEVISKIIRGAGYQWKKARKVLTSNDPDYRAKLSRIQSILGGLKSDERFFSIDEFGPCSVRIRGGRRLVPPGKHPRVPQIQRSKGAVMMMAALELSTNQVTHFYIERKTTVEVLRLIDVLLEQYSDASQLYLSWDAASWHSSRELVQKVWEVNDHDYRRVPESPAVELVPLPSCAQFLNVIESVFSGMARAIIHNSDYESAEAVRLCIDRYFKGTQRTL
jgi:transposase